MNRKVYKGGTLYICMKQKLSIYLDEDFITLLQLGAQKTKRTLSNFIEFILFRHFEEDKKK